MNNSFAFKQGEKALFCTVTLYYVGEIEQVGFGWVRLKNASWVHWTGRLSTLCKVQDFKSPELSSRPPRVEPCGRVIVFTGSLVSAYPWDGDLPTEPIE